VSPPHGSSLAGTPLSAEQLQAQLTVQPGWTLFSGGSGIFRDYPFTTFGGAALFFTYFTALAWHLPFGLDWEMDMIGYRVAVALGPLQGPLTAEIFLLAQIVDEMARSNHLDESG
jgi:pterin-4a-carbinolamine dehydratase